MSLPTLFIVCLNILLLAPWHECRHAEADESLSVVLIVKPEQPTVNETVTMTCDYHFGRGKLYAIKFYKDSDEFYRYVPSQAPPTLFFPVKYVHVEIGATENVIQVGPLHLNAGGIYSCEVSTDAPNFETVLSRQNVTVLPATEIEEK